MTRPHLIAMNGDSRKSEIAAAQNYFAVVTRAHEMHQLRQERAARIQIRLEVAEGNKQLSEAAAEAGVGSQMFGVFHDAGYLGQYTLDAENIRIYKGIPEGGEILDYMGREELVAIMRDHADGRTIAPGANCGRGCSHSGALLRWSRGSRHPQTIGGDYARRSSNS
jgi:hypothetical protein